MMVYRISGFYPMEEVGEVYGKPVHNPSPYTVQDQTKRAAWRPSASTRLMLMKQTRRGHGRGVSLPSQGGNIALLNRELSVAHGEV